MKKKLLVGITILLSVLLFAACGSPSHDWEDIQVHTYTYVYTKDFETMPRIAVIASEADLEVYREEVQTAFNNDSLLAQLNTYTSEFFEGKCIIAIYIGHGFGLSVKGVYLEESTAVVVLLHPASNMDAEDSDVIQPWRFLIELDKSEFSSVSEEWETYKN